MYFKSSDHLVSRHASETRNPIYAARLAMNGQFVVVGGLIAIAVANEKVIAHPHGHADDTIAGLLFGGSMAYLVVQTWYLKLATGAWSLVRVAGVATLVVTAVVLAVCQAEPLAMLVAAAAVNVGLAAAIAWTNRETSLARS